MAKEPKLASDAEVAAIRLAHKLLEGRPLTPQQQKKKEQQSSYQKRWRANQARLAKIGAMAERNSR